MIFRKGGQHYLNLVFYHGDTQLKIANKYIYLDIVFTTRGSFSEAQATLSAQKAIFPLYRHLYKFVSITPYHDLDLFDRLISRISNYPSEVWGFA